VKLHKSGYTFKSICDEFGEVISQSELVDINWMIAYGKVGTAKQKVIYTWRFINNSNLKNQTWSVKWYTGRNTFMENDKNAIPQNQSDYIRGIIQVKLIKDTLGSLLCQVINNSITSDDITTSNSSISHLTIYRCR